MKYTSSGKISVECQAFEDPAGVGKNENVAVEIIVTDTGCGMTSEKLESIFREFEQVEATPPPAPLPSQPTGLGKEESPTFVMFIAKIFMLGLGLAVVARIVEQLGGQLRVDSKVDAGSRFSFLIPFGADTDGSNSTSSRRSRTHSRGPPGNEIDSLVEALASHPTSESSRYPSSHQLDTPTTLGGDSRGSSSPSHKSDSKLLEAPEDPALSKRSSRSKMRTMQQVDAGMPVQLRILIVEVSMRAPSLFACCLCRTIRTMTSTGLYWPNGLL